MARVLGTKSVLMMGNHGVLVVGEIRAARPSSGCIFSSGRPRRRCSRSSTGRPLRLIPGPGGARDRRAIRIGRHGRRPRSRGTALRGAEAHARPQPTRTTRAEPTAQSRLRSAAPCSRPRGARAGIRRARSTWSTLLAVVLFINYIDRGAMPTAAPHDARTTCTLSNPQFGLLISAFSWTYALFQIPVGWLAERYGAHRMLAAGLVIWATATLLIGLSSAFSVAVRAAPAARPRRERGLPLRLEAPRLRRADREPRHRERHRRLRAISWPRGRHRGSPGCSSTTSAGAARSSCSASASLLWLLPWSRVKLPKLATARSDAVTPTWGMVLTQRGALGHEPRALLEQLPRGTSCWAGCRATW